MILDQLNLSQQQVKKFDDISLKNKNKVEKLLEQIFLKTNKDPKWLLTPLFGRDYFQSDFLRDLNFLSLVNYYVKKKKCKIIKVESFFLKKIIQKKYKNINIISKNILKNLFFIFLNLFLSFLKIFIYSIQMLLLKDNNRAEKFKNKNINLIETFFSKNLYNQNYKERYHKNIYSKFPKKIKEKSFFFPVNLSIFYIKKYLDILKGKKIKFIHPLDFLKFKDYIYSIFLVSKLGDLNSGNFFFEKFNINKLIKYHIFISKFNFSTFIASINYFFIKRLKQKKINIEIILDWYENQIIDKGLCLGKNHFSPKTILKGHMGYINDFRKIYYYTPTILEKKKECLPDEILLISKGIYEKFYKKFNYLNFKLVPAIRNQKIFNFKFNKTIISKIKVLIICSANTQENNFIFNILNKIYQKIDFKKFNFIIKLHPNTKINSELKNKKNIKISNNQFYNLLNTSDVVISGGTTATIEAKILNKKIILIGNNQGITLNPLFEDGNKLHICFEPNNLIYYLNKFRTKKNKYKINKKLLNFYFIKYSKKYFKNFYDLV